MARSNSPIVPFFILTTPPPISLVYAQEHPSRVKALILRGIFMLRQSELRWFYEQGGASNIFPGMISSLLLLSSYILSFVLHYLSSSKVSGGQEQVAGRHTRS